MTVCCLLLVRKSGEDMLKNNRSFLDFYLSEMPEACPLYVHYSYENLCFFTSSCKSYINAKCVK